MFFVGGGGWARRGGSLINFLQIEEGQTCFILNWGRVTVFLVRKKLLHVVLFCIYKQSYQSRSIEITYRCRKIYISKNYLLRTNIIVSLDPCPLSPLFWCFRGVLWFIAFKASRTSHWCFLSVTKFVAKAFLVGTSGPKVQVEFWQNTIWEFSIFALWVWEPP